MKLSLACAVVSLSACATTAPPPPVISAHQVSAFCDVVRRAEAAGPAEGSRAATLLRDAKSDYYYAEHLPKEPDRAREMMLRAQAEAEEALRLVSSDPEHKLALQKSLRDPQRSPDLSVTEVTPPVTP